MSVLDALIMLHDKGIFKKTSEEMTLEIYFSQDKPKPNYTACN